MPQMAQVKEGDLVAVRYRALGGEGRLLATSGSGSPLVLTAGGEEVLYGLSYGVIGMEVGERAVLLIDAEDAFGEAGEGVERAIPKSRLPKTLQVGDALQIADEDTRILLWVVGEGSGETWRLSSLHPFAGQDIELHVEVVRP